jgi:hypothetical protein
MAKETTTRLIDDLDGSDADSTVSYTWQGQAYEIDLNDKNAEEFADALAPYLAASRKVGRGSSGAASRRSASTAKPAGDVDPKKVRQWAQENGIEVSPRGRINAKVVEQYKAAQ